MTLNPEPVIDPGFFLKTVLFNLAASLPKFRISDIFLISGLFLFYCYLFPHTAEKKRAVIPAVIFALSMVFGKSFSAVGSWDLVFGLSSGQLIKSCFIFTGYFLLFLYGIAMLYNLMEKQDGKETSAGNGHGLIRRLLRIFGSHPFAAVFLTLLVLYIPRFIISYPGQFMGDSYIQILEPFSELKVSKYKAELLLNDSVFITQHHPVAHTLLMHWFILLGDRFFHSFNGGLYIYSLVQAFCFCAAIAWITSALVKTHIIRPEHAILIVLYNFLNPMIHNYIFLCTKDVYYTVFMLIVTLAIWQILSGDVSRPVVCTLAAGSLGMLLFRNEARYLLPLVFAAGVLLCRGRRKLFLASFAVTVLTSLFIFSFLFIRLGFTPSSLREALSIPFQQTARYVRDHGDEISTYERRAIDKVLNYKKLPEKYTPDRSDRVKKTFKDQATTEDLITYFQVWYYELRQHPGTYLQATIHNYYQFFYPDNDNDSSIYYYAYNYSQRKMGEINSKLSPLDKSFSYPKQTYNFRKLFDKLQPKLTHLLPFSAMLSSAFYVWILIIFLNYGVMRRKAKILMLMAMPAGILLVCLTGPCNGFYGRYLFPFIAALPYLTAMFMSLVRSGSGMGK